MALGSVQKRLNGVSCHNRDIAHMDSAAATACTRYAHNQASQNASVSGGGARDVQALTEQLLATVGFWGMQRSDVTVGGPTPLHRPQR